MLLFQPLTSGEEIESGSTKGVKRMPAFYCSSSSIKGTTFETENTIQYEDEAGWSLHQCRIGYKREDERGSYRISPVIDLPSLTNDRYWVEFTDGSMVVTAHKANRKIVTLHLGGIAPNMITKPQTASGENNVELPKDRDARPYDFEDIAGTSLSICHALPSKAEPGKSTPPSVIGYKRESAERSTFTPVLTLPHLQNDRYAVKFAKGSIFVKTKNDGNDVVELNLENLAPSAITEIYGVQDGADHPTPAPELKPEGKDNPQPEPKPASR